MKSSVIYYSILQYITVNSLNSLHIIGDKDNKKRHLVDQKAFIGGWHSLIQTSIDGVPDDLIGRGCPRLWENVLFVGYFWLVYIYIYIFIREVPGEVWEHALCGTYREK